MEYEKVKTKVETHFIGAKYQGKEETAQELGKLLGGKWKCYDTKIDDGADEDETEDTYIMVSCFECNDKVVRLYYGNVTEEITYVRIN